MLPTLLGYGHGTAVSQERGRSQAHTAVCGGHRERAAAPRLHPAPRTPLTAPAALFQQLPGEECLFLERLEENHYNTYISKKHADKNWFVGLKKNGNSKLGPRTHYGQKAILFLPLPVSAD